jgi:pimeloyl-ACP methyl ester carboxylesterase
MPYPTVILPGYLAAASEYRDLQQELTASSYPARIVPLRVSDWFVTLGGRSVNPILQAIAATVQQVQREFDAPKVNLVGHSAGGWIARIYLGSDPYYERVWYGLPDVATLITLGTPHTSQERWTRFNLTFVNDRYPGAFHPELKYVCVAGRATFGQRLGQMPFGRWDSAAWLAYSSYQLTGGRGDTWGDGITPIEAAHLDGAINLTIDGASHSPRRQRFWYGSPAALRHWLQYLQ